MMSRYNMLGLFKDKENRYRVSSLEICGEKYGKKYIQHRDNTETKTKCSLAHIVAIVYA